jgi:integrase
MLTDAKIKNAQPVDKPYRLYDSGGMYLEIAPSGGRWWRLKYRIGGKEKRISLGVYPTVSLKEARFARDKAKDQLREGLDPGASRRGNTFEELAKEWIDKQSAKWIPSHSERILGRLKRDVFPWMGSKPIASVTAPEVLAVLERVEKRGAGETTRRLFQYTSSIMRYAVSRGTIKADPTTALRGALATPSVRNLPSIREPKALGALLRALDGYEGGFVTRCALRLAPLLFLRPGELRTLQWADVNFEAKEIRIPAPRMKLRREHIVPLSDQALEILEELRPLTGTGKNKKYLFPSVRTAERPMSENTVNMALRALGFDKSQMVGHGFRSIASTLLNESHKFHPDAIERQLAHVERSKVRAAYNHAEHLPERRSMIQWWADEIDKLKAGASPATGNSSVNEPEKEVLAQSNEMHGPASEQAAVEVEVVSAA